MAEVKSTKLEKIVNDMAAKVRGLEDKVKEQAETDERHSENWRRFHNRFVGAGSDVLGLVLALCMLAGVASRASAQVWRPFEPAVYGDFSVTADPASQTADVVVSGDLTMASGATLTISGVTLVGGTISNVLVNGSISGTTTLSGTVAGDNVVLTGLSNTTWTAGSTLTVGTATIVPTSATQLTVTETTITLAGAVGATSLTVTGDLTANSDIVLENDEVIRNDVDGDVELIFDDDAATLGQLVFDTSLTQGSMADDDLYEIVFRGPDTASNATDYVVLQGQITDNTTATEDGMAKINFISGGAAKSVSIGSSAAGAMAMTLPAGMEASIDGKWAVVGPDATGGLMVQAASITATGATLQTNTFATAFGSAPIVTGTYTEDPGGDETLWIVSVSSSTVVFTTVASKNYSYIAVGARP